ncbi:MAG: hypothetical protein GF328_13555 [Candidatus Latescibacteria bacterium]|nr:hypothetical protein [Candidatus Latescibacterota bacterium]
MRSASGTASWKGRTGRSPPDMSSKPFHETLQERHREILERAVRHRFWTDLEAGRLSDPQLLLWLGQEYHHARVIERFVVLLASRAPESLRRQFTKTLLHVHEGIERFEEATSGVDLNLRAARVSLGTHAFNSFLLATAETRSFEPTVAAYYVNSYCFFHGWSRAVGGGDRSPLRNTLQALLGEPVYKDWVGGLESAVDEAAVSEADKAEMLTIVPVAIEFQTGHWDGIYEELFA